MSPPALWTSQLSDSLLYMKRKARSLGYSPQNTGASVNPQGIITRNRTVWHWNTPLPQSCYSLLVKVTKKIIVGSPLSIFIPHTVEDLLNSHHTQHFSVSCLTSCEILLLTALHIVLLFCNNLNPATLLPSITDKVPHHYLILTGHLQTPYDDLQEIRLRNADISRSNDGSYLKGDNGQFL